MVKISGLNAKNSSIRPDFRSKGSPTGPMEMRMQCIKDYGFYRMEVNEKITRPWTFSPGNDGEQTPANVILLGRIRTFVTVSQVIDLAPK